MLQVTLTHQAAPLNSSSYLFFASRRHGSHQHHVTKKSAALPVSSPQLQRCPVICWRPIAARAHTGLAGKGDEDGVAEITLRKTGVFLLLQSSWPEGYQRPVL